LLQQIVENLQVRHDADATSAAELQNLGRVKVTGVSGAKDVGLTVRGRVQYRIVGGIGQDYGPGDYRLNQVRRIRQASAEARRFFRPDPIALLDTRIKEHALEPRRE
jgi:hypothetical protein